MKVKKVRIQEFKGFKDLTIDLGNNPARIIALVGANGCGKSSVFDAFLAKMSLENNTVGESAKFHDDWSFWNNSISFKNNTLNKRNLIEISYDEQIDTTGTLVNIFSFRSSYRYNTDLNIKEIRALENIKKNNYGAGSSINLDTRIHNNYRYLLAYYNNYRDENDLQPSKVQNLPYLAHSFSYEMTTSGV